jgi:hypothetical protein
MDRGKIAGAITRQKHEYLFRSGRARCGTCSYAMSGFYRAERSTRFYRCSANKHVAQARCWRTVHASALEDAVWERVCLLLDEPEYFRLELERRRSGESQQEAVQRHDIEIIERKIQELRSRLQRWMDAYAVGTISLDELSVIKKPIDAEIKALSVLHDELDIKISATHHKQEEIEAAVAFIQRVSTEIPAYSIPEKRRVLELLQVSVIYYDMNNIHLKFLIPADDTLSPVPEHTESPL